MWKVDFAEKQRHVFGAVSQRMPNPLVYPFPQNILELPPLVLLSFRLSRLLVMQDCVDNQRKLCETNLADVNSDYERTQSLFPSVCRLLELCLEKIKRANYLDARYLGKPEFKEFLPVVTQNLITSKDQVLDQLNFAKESLLKSRDIRLSKESLAHLEKVRDLISSIENSQSYGYEFATNYLSSVDNIDTQPTQ